MSVDNLVGRRLKEYHLKAYLGRGTYGEVYLAEHVRHLFVVAIKILYADLGNVESIGHFLNEARLIRFEHPNIVRVRDFGMDTQTGRPFLVMDYIKDGNLRQRHPRGAQLSWKTIVPYIKQVAEALQYVHDQGLVHRDVKPENLLIGSQGEILLTDFGIATLSYTWDPHNLQYPMGTAFYVAPEQIQAQAVRASDQYALGIVIYEWLTGELPFVGTLDELLTKHVRAQPIPPSQKRANLLPSIDALVMKMLAKDPTARFASMRDLCVALNLIETPIRILKPLIFKKHTDGVRACAWSPYHTYVASAGRDTTIHVWEVSAGDIVCSYHNHTGEIRSVSWSPDGRFLVSAGDDKTAQVWEATTGYLVTAYQHHKDVIHAVAWSPDGIHIASAGDDRTVQIWNARTGDTITIYTRHTREVYAIAWSPDGSYIASGGDDGSVRVWEAKNGSLQQITHTHRDRVTALAWSPDGSYLASASRDCTIRLWDVQTGNECACYTAHDNTVTAIAWSPTSPYIASGSWDKSIHVWQVNATAPTMVYRQHENWVSTVSWSPDGKQLVSGSWDKTVHIFEFRGR
jgi:WD40 repeat protein